MNKLEYYVMTEDFNSSDVRMFNIFNHTYIDKELSELLKSYTSYEDFKERLTRLFKYCYMGKREWEMFVEVRNKEIKVSAYKQIESNIDLIIDYIIREYNKHHRNKIGVDKK